MTAAAFSQCDFPQRSSHRPNAVGSAICLQTAHPSGSPVWFTSAAPLGALRSGGSLICFHGQCGLSQQPGCLPSFCIKSLSLANTCDLQLGYGRIYSPIPGRWFSRRSGVLFRFPSPQRTRWRGPRSGQLNSDASGGRCGTPPVLGSSGSPCKPSGNTGIPPHLWSVLH